MSTQEARIYNGRYELVRHVARGGMAEVYQAHDLLLDRRVALKVLFPELSVDKSFVERFRREAQAAASLSHQGIVSIYDWGEEDGTYFIVMEYVDGRPLSQVLKTEGRLPADRAAQIGAGTAAALSSAHRHGVVHRDVKPGNILLDATGTVKVTDFGIARAGDPTENLTQVGVVMGTATYFSPEQAQGHDVDARTDVYSLGVVLYEMLTGRPPFSGETPVAIAYKHVKEDPTPPRQLEPSIPSDLEAIVLAAMAKDRDDRYPSADELRSDLIRFARGQQPKAVRVREVLAAAAAGSAAAGATTVVAPIAAAADATTAMPAMAPPPAAATIGIPPRSDPSVVPLAAPAKKDRTGLYAVTSLVLLGVLVVLLVLLARLFGGTGGTSTVQVASVVGQTEEAAKKALEDQDLKVKVTDQQDPTKPIGQVLRQLPEAGATVGEGTTVELFVARGGGQVEVPTVANLQQAEAESAIRAAGLVPQVQQARNADVSEGFVISQDPAPRAMAAKGATVTLLVSTGNGLPPIPNVVGQPQGAAVNALQEAGYRVRILEEVSASVEQGLVTRTDPAAGQKLARGQTTVGVYVSKGAGTTTVARVTVPSVVGLTQAEATAQLEAAGLTVQPVESAGGTAGRVRAQNPAGGSKVNPGTSVVITVSRGTTTTTTSSTTTTSTILPTTTTTTDGRGTGD